jgi:competence protein ComEA
MSQPGLSTPQPLPTQEPRSRSFQLAITFLLGIGTALAGVRLYQGRLTRPLESQPAALRLDLNSATPQQLLQLPRVGPAMAERIVDARPFADLDDVRRVSGIGQATLDKIKPHVAVNGGTVTYSAKPVANHPINVNSATVAELQTLPGIGPKMAQRIISEREKRAFASIEELRRVSGIGPKTLEKLRPYVEVD